MAPAKEKWSELTAKLSPTDYLDYRQYLSALYLKKKAASKRYSYMQFAEDLGFSKTNVLYLVIKGKRPLSVKAGQKIIAVLGLTGVPKNYFDTLVRYQNAKIATEREKLFQTLRDLKARSIDSTKLKAQLDFFSEWYHTAIYEMTMMADFSSDPRWIVDHIEPRIRPEQARKSLHLLEALGLVAFHKEEGRHFPTQARVSTGDEIASVAITRYHQKMIEIGRESITRVADSNRDISSITISIPLPQLAKYKREISMFRKKLLAMADSEEDKDTVFQMNVQLFPLTTAVEKDDDKSGGESN